MSDDLRNRLRRYCTSAPHDTLACDALAEIERQAQEIAALRKNDEILSAAEEEADRIAIARFQQRLADDFRAAEERGRVATRIEWRGYLRRAIKRERELRAEVGQLRAALDA